MDAEEMRRRTKTFAYRIIKLFEALPNRPAAEIIGRQLLRAGTSVGANYRAACRARSRTEFVAKLGIVIEEADESIYWLEMLADNNIVRPQLLKDLLVEANELTAICVAARETTRSTRVREITDRQSQIANG